MRREHVTDDCLHAGAQRRLGRVGDARRPVLHAGVDGDVAKLAFERGARFFCDRVQRRAVLDPKAPVALDQVVEQLGSNRPAAANVGVVRRDVGKPLRRAVCHQHNGRARQTRASTVTSCTYSVRRRKTAGSVSGGTPCPRLNT